MLFFFSEMRCGFFQLRKGSWFLLAMSPQELFTSAALRRAPWEGLEACREGTDKAAFHCVKEKILMILSKW